jgi:hypothetical protein
MSTENIKDDNVPSLDVATADHGDVTVHADQLPTVTEDELKMLGMSRDELLRCFAEGAKLMADYAASDRVRPVASQTLDGKWEVRIERYSELSDPLMQGPGGTA